MVLQIYWKSLKREWVSLGRLGRERGKSLRVEERKEGRVMQEGVGSRGSMEAMSVGVKS